MYYKSFFLAMLVFLVFDLIWIGYVGNSLYREGYGDLLRKTGDFITPNWYSAIIVYTLCVLGITIFIIPTTGDNLSMASLYGALYGLVLYGFYNFTNYSVFTGWPLNITLIDTVWGTILCSITSVTAAYFS